MKHELFIDLSARHYCDNRYIFFFLHVDQVHNFFFNLSYILLGCFLFFGHSTGKIKPIEIENDKDLSSRFSHSVAQ